MHQNFMAHIPMQRAPLASIDWWWTRHHLPHFDVHVERPPARTWSGRCGCRDFQSALRRSSLHHPEPRQKFFRFWKYTVSNRRADAIGPNQFRFAGDGEPFGGKKLTTGDEVFVEGMHERDVRLEFSWRSILDTVNTISARCMHHQHVFHSRLFVSVPRRSYHGNCHLLGACAASRSSALILYIA
jgi:hypothetical protein